MSCTGKTAVGTVAYLGGIPAVHEEFAWSWSQMVQFNSEFIQTADFMVHYDRAKISFHAAARNFLVERMLGDWLVMLDADQQFDPDVVARLVNSAEQRQLDVLTGVYVHRTPPYLPVLYLKNHSSEGFRTIATWPEDSDVIEVDGAGAGCLFVRKTVFDRITTELQEKPFDVRHPYGEDLSFFRRLNDLGIKVHCDTRIKIGHLAAMPLDSSHTDLMATPLIKQDAFLSQQIQLSQ